MSLTGNQLTERSAHIRKLEEAVEARSAAVQDRVRALLVNELRSWEEKSRLAAEKESEEKAKREREEREKEAKRRRVAEEQEAERKQKEAERRYVAEKQEAERKQKEREKEAERRRVAEEKEAERVRSQQKAEQNREIREYYLAHSLVGSLLGGVVFGGGGVIIEILGVNAIAGMAGFLTGLALIWIVGYFIVGALFSGMFNYDGTQRKGCGILCAGGMAGVGIGIAHDNKLFISMFKESDLSSKYILIGISYGGGVGVAIGLAIGLIIAAYKRYK